MVLSFSFCFSIKDKIQKHTAIAIMSQKRSFLLEFLSGSKQKAEEYTYFLHAFGGRKWLVSAVQ